MLKIHTSVVCLKTYAEKKVNKHKSQNTYLWSKTHENTSNEQKSRVNMHNAQHLIRSSCHTVCSTLCKHQGLS